jgi:hypothetical protein
MMVKVSVKISPLSRVRSKYRSFIMNYLLLGIKLA